MNSKIIAVAVFLGLVSLAVAGVLENPSFCPMQGSVPKIRFTGCTKMPCLVSTYAPFTYNFDVIPAEEHEGFRIEVSNLNTRTWALNRIFRHTFPYTLVKGSRFNFNLDLSYYQKFEPTLLQVQVIGANGAVEACSILGMEYGYNDNNIIF